MHLALLRYFRSSLCLSSKSSLYSILGVAQSSSESEIKQAYFSLAKKFHPDVNKDPKAKEKFSEISQAYETLGNPERKKDYDSSQSPKQAPEPGRSSNFYSPNEENSSFNPYTSYSQNFTSFEDIYSEFEDIFTNYSKEKANTRGGDISIKIELEFMDSVKGIHKQVSFDRKGVCASCNGSKAKAGTSASLCPACGGKGTMVIQRGPISMQTPCSKCQGTGSYIRATCRPCDGSGVALASVWETIQVPAGVSDGQILKFHSKGHVSDKKGPQGDLLVQLLVASHRTWKRKNYDILSEVSISISQAALGCILQVETLVGTSKLFIEPGCNSGDLKKFVGLGIPHLPPNTHKRGDHIITVKINVPRSLNEKQRKLLEQLALEDEAAGSEGTFNKFKTFYK